MIRGIKLVMLCSLCFMTSCKKEGLDTSVHFYGALKTMMSGDLKATVALDSISKKEHLYALGAAENLKGEIQILDGEVSNSFVKNNEIQIENTTKGKAALLVYAQVQDWISLSIPKSIDTKKHLEAFVFEKAEALGIATEDPFPFLIEGEISKLQWHVIDWPEQDMVHTHQKHQESGLNGSFSNEQVKILGFYSEKHKTIFTHHSTNMHLHFITDKLSIAGHVDDVIVGHHMIIKFPKQ